MLKTATTKKPKQQQTPSYTKFKYIAMSLCSLVLQHKFSLILYMFLIYLFPIYHDFEKEII